MTSEEKDLGKGKGRGKGQDKGQGKGKDQKKAGTNEVIIGMVEKNELNITETLPGTRGLDTIIETKERASPKGRGRTRKKGTGKGQNRKKGERKG
jgi:hypothetical protein